MSNAFIELKHEGYIQNINFTWIRIYGPTFLYSTRGPSIVNDDWVSAPYVSNIARGPIFNRKLNVIYKSLPVCHGVFPGLSKKTSMNFA